METEKRVIFMPISRRIKFVCKLLFQFGLAAGLIFIFSGCGQRHFIGDSLFVWPDLKLAGEERPDEIIVKQTIAEKAPSPQLLTKEEAEKERFLEAEETQMASEKFGNFGARQGFAPF